MKGNKQETDTERNNSERKRQNNRETEATERHTHGVAHVRHKAAGKGARCGWRDSPEQASPKEMGEKCLLGHSDADKQGCGFIKEESQRRLDKPGEIKELRADI